MILHLEKKYEVDVQNPSLYHLKDGVQINEDIILNQW